MHQTVSDSVVDAFMALLGAKPYEAIGLRDVATGAGLTLGQLRGAADGKLSILGAFIRRVDRAVLDEDEAAHAGDDTGRDRLFDLVMRRFDRLSPYKSALRHLAASARRDPALALALNGLALPSAGYLLAACGIGTDGLRGLARMQGLVMLTSQVLHVWLDDVDPDQSRTMAALDHALSRAEGWDRRAGKAERALCRIVRRFERRDSAQAKPFAAESGAVA